LNGSGWLLVLAGPRRLRGRQRVLRQRALCMSRC
jgi:hypothetical protein